MNRNNKIFDEGYYQFDLEYYKYVINSNKLNAFLAINRCMQFVFYTLGDELNKKVRWKEKYIELMKADSSIDSRIMTDENIEGMCKFASYFNYTDMLSLKLDLIEWSLLRFVLINSKSRDELVWYINQITEKSLSEPDVSKMFEDNVFEKINEASIGEASND